MEFLLQALIFLAAAVIAVPLAKRLGLGSVLGYLVAGVVVGPDLLGLFDDVDDVLHFAEFGVVLLLFIIGLELQPARLWTLRRAVFGLGGGQVVLTALAIMAVALALGQDIHAALVAGLALALSSTAFVLQILHERREVATRHGRAAFGVLLFQDLAVIPILAALPLLAVGQAASSTQDAWLAVGQGVLAIAAVAVGGRYLLRGLLRVVAGSRVREVFTATALFTVIGVALLMDLVGLSMALGAFLAGVLLADSEYRHELEADIEPFKGLLLGLFFIAVGMSVDLGLLLARPLLVLALVLALIALKALVVVVIARLARHSWNTSALLAISLAQGGEFAFVILGVGMGVELLDPATASLLILVVTLSMAATPLLFLLHDLWVRRMAKTAEPEYDGQISEENQVIIAGMGRVGQIVGRVLAGRRIGFTALESDAAQVDFVRRFGNKVHYGDAGRLDLLRAAKADQAVLFVLAIEDVEQSLATARMVVKHFPHLRILARARNRQHAYALMDLGIRHVVRDTYYSSLELTRQALTELGHEPDQATRIVETFRDHDIRRLHAQREVHKDLDRMAAENLQWTRELEALFEEDARENEER